VIFELSSSGTPIRLRIFDEDILESALVGVDDNCYEIFNSGSFFDAMEGVSIAFTTHSSISVPLVNNLIPTTCFLYRSEPIEPCYGWYYFKGLSLPSIISEMREAPIEKMEFQRSAFESFNNKELGEIVSGLVPSHDHTLDPDKAQKMLDSVWNFNVQYMLYRIYLKVKSFSVVKNVRKVFIER